MNSLEHILQQRQKELKHLTIFLTLSLMGSLGVHLAALTLKVGNLWMLDSITTPRETEIAVVDVPKISQQVPPDMENHSITTAGVRESTSDPVPEISTSPASLPRRSATPALDKNSPTDQQSAPKTEKTKLVTGKTGEIPLPSGHGTIKVPNVNGNGFGNASVTQPAGISGATLIGDPQRKIGGTPEGKSNGIPGGNSTATAPSKPGAPDPVPPTSTNRLKPQCISCPKPQYRGKEGAPKVTYDIAPDGRVINIRLRQSSGDPETDRATLETMSQWRFNPQTIPEGGQRNVRVKVTFEEKGSSYQRQNEQRRQQAEQSRPKNPQVTTQPVAKPVPATNSASASAPPASPSVAPAPPPEPVVPAPSSEPTLPPPEAVPPPATTPVASPSP